MSFDCDPHFAKADPTIGRFNSVSAPKTTLSPDKPRALSGLFDLQDKQIGFLVETMRRVEELADRLLGSAPSLPQADTPEYSSEGVMGALHSHNRDRQIAITRIAEAMDRIESAF